MRAGKCPYSDTVVVDRCTKLPGDGMYPARRFQQLILSCLPLINVRCKEAMRSDSGALVITAIRNVEPDTLDA